LITTINELGHLEGNFPWHVTHHPYPENLFEARFWNDKTAIFRFDTPRITFKNLEVLSVFLRQDHFRFNGKVRRIILGEQGFSTPNRPDGEQIQAAAYAYAFYKVNHIPEIDTFLYFTHVSSEDPMTAGLKLGLRKWKEGSTPDNIMPGPKQFIWDVFRQADTDQWESAFAFAKPIIGIKDWSEVLPNFEMDTSTAPAITEQIVYDFYENMSHAVVSNEEAIFASGRAIKAGWPVPVLLYGRLPQNGATDVTYQVDLPQISANQSLEMRFETMLGGPSETGNSFAVFVDGVSVWQHLQTDKSPKPHIIDLSRWSSRSIAITLRADRLGDSGNSDLKWAQPRIILEIKNEND